MQAGCHGEVEAGRRRYESLGGCRSNSYRVGLERNVYTDVREKCQRIGRESEILTANSYKRRVGFRPRDDSRTRPSLRSRASCRSARPPHGPLGRLDVLMAEGAVAAARPAADAAAEQGRGREDFVSRLRVDVGVSPLGPRARMQPLDLVHTEIVRFSGNKEGCLSAALSRRFS